MDKNSARREKLADYLRSLRNSLGMSQRAVSQKAGMSSPYLAQIELGQRMPSRDMIARLADVYAVSKELLLKEAGYIEGESLGVETERIDWAFEAVCRDSDFRYGTRVRRQPFDLHTKALICEIYTESTGRQLFKTDETAAINDLIQSQPRIEEEVGQEICGAFKEMVVALRRRHPDSPIQVPDIMDCLSTAWERGEFNEIMWLPTSPESLPKRAIKKGAKKHE